MITFVLHGVLGQRFAHPETGHTWALDVQSIGEGLHAIDTLKGGLIDFLVDMEREVQGYHVQVDGGDIGDELLPVEFPGSTVTITPIYQGADTKGILQIVAGVALIAVGVALAYPTLGGSLGLTGAIGLQLVGLGLAVSLGGVARLLAATPDSTLGTQDKTKSSYIFSGPVNTVQQGECVPVIYGEVICGSAVIAAGIESVDIEV